VVKLIWQVEMTAVLAAGIGAAQQAIMTGVLVQPLKIYSFDEKLQVFIIEYIEKLLDTDGVIFND
jgi:hypothetical protein